MNFNIESIHLGSVVVIKSDVFEDKRGFFTETYREDKFQELGLPYRFVQDNHSRSSKNVLRGLHFQWDPAMAKLMRVTYGEAFLVAVDIRKGSPTLGKFFGDIFSATNSKQLFASAGFARGFCVLSDYAEIQYKCTGHYNHRFESGVLWNDSEIGINWPIEHPILSKKDMKAQTLSQWLENVDSNNFIYHSSDDIN